MCEFSDFYMLISKEFRIIMQLRTSERAELFVRNQISESERLCIPMGIVEYLGDVVVIRVSSAIRCWCQASQNRMDLKSNGFRHLASALSQSWHSFS